jgi:AcrR family transcriptional regulator
MSTRRTERKRENHAKLLAAARNVFAEKGLGAATARDIVRETDLATGTFYNYFDDKEDAFRAVLEDFTAQASARAGEMRRQAGVGLEERIFNAYCAYFELVVADPQMFEILRRNVDAVAMVGADVFEQAVLEFVEDMGAWVAEGQLSPEIQPWLLYVARSIAGGAFQIAAHMADEGVSDVDATARFCTRLMLDGIRGFA